MADVFLGPASFANWFTTADPQLIQKLARRHSREREKLVHKYDAFVRDSCRAAMPPIDDLPWHRSVLAPDVNQTCLIVYQDGSAETVQFHRLEPIILHGHAFARPESDSLARIIADKLSRVTKTELVSSPRGEETGLEARIKRLVAIDSGPRHVQEAAVARILSKLVDLPAEASMASKVVPEPPAVSRPETVATIEEPSLVGEEVQVLNIGRQSIRDRFRDPHHAEAGLASYTAGVVAAAAFVALAIGPGWVGFLAGFLPASLLTSWAAASHA